MRALLVPFFVLAVTPKLYSQTLLKYLDWTPQTRACCMAADSNGNVYAAGIVSRPSPEDPLTTRHSVTVTKLDRNNNVIYTFDFGGEGDLIPQAIAVDSEGNLFVAGRARVAGFPVVNPLISTGPSDCCLTGFLSKIDALGTQLLFSTLIGGTTGTSTTVYAIAVDAAGNILLTGSTQASDFPVTQDAYQTNGPTCTGFGCPSYAFLTKITNSGDRIVYSTFLGTPEAACYGGSSCIGVFGGSGGYAIAVGADGTITVAGYTTAYEFPTTPGALQANCRCTYQHGTGFVTRFSPDGTEIIWSTFLGGGGAGPYIGGDLIGGLGLAMDGSVVVAGLARSPDFPVTLGAFQTSLAAVWKGQGVPANAFISKLDPTGSTLVFSTFLGGSTREEFSGLQLDLEGRPWITGTTFSPDFPSLPESLKLGNTFLAGLSSDGSSLVSSNQFPNGAAGIAIALDPFGNHIALGDSGSLLRIPPGGLSGTSVLGQANAAGYSVSNRVSPGEIISLYGTGLGPNSGLGAQIDDEGKLTTMLGGVEVLFDGNPAPLLYVSDNQINVVVPFQVADQEVTSTQVKTAASTSEIIPFKTVDADPQIFAVFPTYPRKRVAALNEDGSINSITNPAKPCSIVSVWAHGAGLLMPAVPDGFIFPPALPLPVPLLPVSMILQPNSSLHRQPAEILYVGGAPGMVAGVIQINFRLQESGSSDYPIQLQVGDKLSDIIYVPVERGECP